MLRILQILTLLIFVVHIGTTQELTVFPGFLSNQFYQDSQRITRSEFMELLNSDAESLVFLDKRKKQHTIVGISIGAYIGSSIWLGSIDNRPNADNFNNNVILPGIIFLGSLVAGTVFSFKARNNFRNAVLKYNDNLTLDFRPTNNGLGLILSF